MKAFCGEDEFVLNRLGRTGFFVDIGAGNGETWSNTCELLNAGWRGVMVECDEIKLAHLRLIHNGKPVTVIDERVDAKEVVGKLRQVGVPDKFQFLSVDIDGMDAYVLEAVLREMDADLVIAEFNHYVPPPIRWCMKYTKPFVWAKNQMFGCSLQHLCDVMERRRYWLIQCFLNNAAFAKSPGEARSAVDLWEEQVKPLAVKNGGQHSIPASWPPGNIATMRQLKEFFGDSDTYALSMTQIPKKQLGFAKDSS